MITVKVFYFNLTKIIITSFKKVYKDYILTVLYLLKYKALLKWLNNIKTIFLNVFIVLSWCSW